MSTSSFIRVATAVAALASASHAAPFVQSPLEVARESQRNAFGIAASDTGRFLVAWRSTRPDARPAGLFYRLYGADGRPATGALRLDMARGFGAQVLARPDGGFWVVYAVGAGGLRARRISSSGVPAAVPVVAGNAGVLFDFVARGTPDGGFVVWSHSSIPFNQETVRSFDAAGGSRGPGQQWGGAGSPTRLAVAADGTALLAEEAVVSAGFGQHAYLLVGRRFAVDGSQLGEQLQLTPDVHETRWQSSFDVAAAPDGAFLLTWLEAGPEGFSTSLRRLVGERELGEIRPAGHRPSGGPSVATPSGGFALAWNTGPWVARAPAVLAAQEHGAGGAPLGAPIVIASTRVPGGATPVLATDGHGNYLAAWWGTTACRSGYPLLVSRWRF